MSERRAGMGERDDDAALLYEVLLSLRRARGLLYEFGLSHEDVQRGIADLQFMLAQVMSAVHDLRSTELKEREAGGDG
jgi:hypothetical protein